MVASASAGIHHVTAVASDPQRNIDFYAGVLGLRLVKRTVNFDDPETYHFYYGDQLGRPGTIITFFPMSGSRPGRRGAGQVAVTAFSIASESSAYWRHRLESADVVVESSTRFDEEVLGVRDPDGLKLELVAGSEANRNQPWTQGPVPPEHAIRGLHSVSLASRASDATAGVLTDVLAARLLAEADGRLRFRFGDDGPGKLVDLVPAEDAARGMGGVGTVHHVAWRAVSDEQHGALLEKVAARGLNVTEVLDRNYFRSIYFRESGGILFEIATDGPGFSVDEPADSLGHDLKLPGWLEADRERIEASLSPIQIPAALGDPRAR